MSGGYGGAVLMYFSFELAVVVRDRRNVSARPELMYSKVECSVLSACCTTSASHMALGQPSHICT